MFVWQSKMKDQDVPHKMRHRVTSYLDYVWVRNKGHQLEGLFDEALPCLVAEVFNEIASSFFSSVCIKLCTCISKFILPQMMGLCQGY